MPGAASVVPLLSAPTVADLMAADPVIEPILPIMGRRDGAVHIAFDGDEGYYEVGTHPWAQRSDI